MTTPTVGSSISLFWSPLFRNLTRMNGSTFPPHDFLLYMPEHFCASSRVRVTSIAATAVNVDSSSSPILRSHCCFIVWLEASWRRWRRVAELTEVGLQCGGRKGALRAAPSDVSWPLSLLRGDEVGAEGGSAESPAARVVTASSTGSAGA